MPELDDNFISLFLLKFQIGKENVWHTIVTRDEKNMFSKGQGIREPQEHESIWDDSKGPLLNTSNDSTYHYLEKHLQVPMIKWHNQPSFVCFFFFWVPQVVKLSCEITVRARSRKIIMHKLWPSFLSSTSSIQIHAEINSLWRNEGRKKLFKFNRNWNQYNLAKVVPFQWSSYTLNGRRWQLIQSGLLHHNSALLDLLNGHQFKLKNVTKKYHGHLRLRWNNDPVKVHWQVHIDHKSQKITHLLVQVDQSRASAPPLAYQSQLLWRQRQ